MDQKTFNKLTKEVFLEYGFTKQKDNYILKLEDITIFVVFRSWRGIKSFSYYFYLNHLHDRSSNDEIQFDLMAEIKLEHDTSVKGYHRHEILFEQYEEDEYKNMLRQMLRSYFDTYKANALQFLKDHHEEYLLSNRARIFLDVIDYEKGKEIITEGNGRIPLHRLDEYKNLRIPKDIEAQWIEEIRTKR